MRRFTAAAAVIVALVACAGLPRLTLDGDAPWRLDPDDPLVAANQRLNALTGGDDIVAVVVQDEADRPGGLLQTEGVAAVEAVRAAMESAPGLERVRAVTTAPLVDQSGGTLRAITPLRPPPTDDKGWVKARAQVAADPFAMQLIGRRQRVTVVVGWVVRGGADTALVRRASTALRSGGLEPAAALELRKLMSAARLAVALGDAEGPPDVAAARALRGSPDVVARGWVREAETRSQKPDLAALADVQAAIASLDLPKAVSARVVGPAATEQALEAETPRAIRYALLAVLAAAGLAGWRRRRRPTDGVLPVVAGTLAFGGTFGACGWLGVGLHPWIAVVALLAAAWTSSLVVAGRGRAWWAAPALAAPAGLALALGGGPGTALAAGCAAFLGLALAAGLARQEEPAVPNTSAPAGPTWVFAAVAILALGALVGRPLGTDSARMLDGRHAVGAATKALAQATGTAPSAFLVFDAGKPNVVARPSTLEAIAAGQSALLADDAVSGSASWADLIAGLHGAMTGSNDGALPQDAALVEQYLLLFGRPQDTRSLAAPDGSIATALLRLAPGGGRHLARLSDEFPADGGSLTLAGQGVAMARASRSRARASLNGFAVGSLLLLLGLFVGRPHAAKSLVIALGCAGAAAALASWTSGATGLSAVVASAIALSGSSATLLGGRSRVAAAPLLALGILVLSPVTILSSLALGACAGLALSIAAASRSVSVSA